MSLPQLIVGKRHCRILISGNRVLISGNINSCPYLTPASQTQDKAFDSPLQTNFATIKPYCATQLEQISVVYV